MDFTSTSFAKSNKPGEIDDEGMVLFFKWQCVNRKMRIS